MQTIINSIPDGVCSLDDYQQLAQRNLAADIWSYIAGAAADGLTLKRNREALDSLLLQQRVLSSGLGQGHCKTQVLHQQLDMPVLVAPVAYQKLAHPMGELATVQAAFAQGAGFVLSTLASSSIEEVKQASPQASPWFQLYCQPDIGVTLELVRRAETAGYSALVVTVDAPINGIRNSEQRSGFQLPDNVQAVNLTSGLPKSRSNDSVFAGWMQQAPTWETLERLRSETDLPILVKGIMCPLDAARAISLGADGLVVSNHGGRVLDSQAASIEVLSAVKAAIPENTTLILDSGIRRGSDIFKAIALGADAVMIGRPVLYALATAGPIGVAHILRILRDELEATMALCGCATINDITADALYTGQKLVLTPEFR